MKRYKHGTVTMYKYGPCRKCAPCREANRIEVQKQRKKRQQWLKNIDGRSVCTKPGVMHGHSSTYNNWYCRCVPCTEAIRVSRHRYKN